MREAVFQISSAAAYFAQATFTYTVVIYAQAVTGTTVESGLLFMAVYVPLLVLGLYAGAVADRHSRRHILMGGQWVLVVLSAVAVAVVGTGLREHAVQLLLLLCLLYGTAIAFLPATRLAYASNLVPDEAVERTTTLLKILNIAAAGGGPFVTGWIKARADWAVVFAVPAGLWLTSTLLLMPLRPLRESKPPSDGVRSWGALLEGLRVVGGTPLLRGLCVLSGVIFFLVTGPYQVLVPHFAQDVLGVGEVQRGTLMGSFGLGLLVGGILSTGLTQVRARGLLLVGTLFLSTSPFLVFGYQASYSLSVALLGLCGAFGGVFYSLLPTTLQVVTPDRLRGRVLSVYYVLMAGAPALGAAGFGWLSNHVGVVTTLRLAGFGAVAVSVIALLALRSVTQYVTGREARLRGSA
jgi:MFS family permease